MASDRRVKRRGPNAPLIDGTLTVSGIRCRDLIAADENGKSDPYIKLALVNNRGGAGGGEGVREQEQVTEVKNKTLNPNFESSETPFVFHLDSVQTLPKLLMVAMDQDFMVADDFLGEVSIDLEAAFGFQGESGWLGEMEATVVFALSDPFERLRPDALYDRLEEITARADDGADARRLCGELELTLRFVPIHGHGKPAPTRNGHGQIAATTVHRREEHRDDGVVYESDDYETMRGGRAPSPGSASSASSHRLEWRRQANVERASGIHRARSRSPSRTMRGASPSSHFARSPKARESSRAWAELDAQHEAKKAGLARPVRTVAEAAREAQRRGGRSPRRLSPRRPAAGGPKKTVSRRLDLEAEEDSADNAWMQEVTVALAGVWRAAGKDAVGENQEEHVQLMPQSDGQVLGKHTSYGETAFTIRHGTVQKPSARHVRVQLIGHLYPCMTEIYLHTVARRAD